MNLDDRSRVIIGRSMAVVMAALALTAFVLYLASGEAAQMVDDWALHNIWAALFTAGVVVLALPQVPRNGAVWALAWAGVFSSLQASGAAVGVAVAGVSNGDVQSGTVAVAPADLEFVAALGLNVALWAWVPALFTLVTFAVLLFPDGRVPSRPWSGVGWLAVAAMVVLVLPWAWSFRPSNTGSYALLYADLDDAWGIGVGFLALLIAVVASMAGLVVKWRRSDHEERLQFRWVGWALLVFAVCTVVVLSISTDAYRIVSLVLIPVLSISYGVAITKYRLYDIDVVVSRTFVYGALAIFIAVTYVVIVAGIGAALGGGEDSSPLLAVGATALIALAFQPLRLRLERVANRLVYGKRATPYEALSEFSRGVAAADDQLVSLAAESLVGGTGAETAEIWVLTEGSWVRTAAFPLGVAASDQPNLELVGSLDRAITVPVEHDGELLGAVRLRTAAGHRLTESDARLTAEAAAAMGLALRNQRLTDAVRRRVEQLRESRRRIVAIQDETRRTLERDLHDGAQQQLVALKVKLGLAGRLAATDGAERTAAALALMSSDADEAVDTMRDFARGIYPPLLESEGLGAALRAQARRYPLPVTVEVDGIGRYDRDTEATVYFCVVETLSGATSHGDAGATVAVSQNGGLLSFRISVESSAGGTLDQNGGRLLPMTDRVGAMSGRLRTEVNSDHGTTIIGELPIAGEVSP